jgi:hypothetical protein
MASNAGVCLCTLAMSVDMKFYIVIAGDHIDIESFYRFRKRVTPLKPVV